MRTNVIEFIALILGLIAALILTGPYALVYGMTAGSKVGELLDNVSTWIGGPVSFVILCLVVVLIALPSAILGAAAGFFVIRGIRLILRPS